MDYIKSYADFLRKYFKLEKPLRVVFDCSNGTTGIVLKELFRDPSPPAGGSGRPSVFLINEKPDGHFPAHGPNPMAEGATEDLKKAVLKNKADLGVIFDADGDRVFFVDDKGKLIIPDAAIFLLAENFKGPVALAINVGILARELLAKSRRKMIDSRVGHYFVKKIIREKKVNFAAEISGHYYFSAKGGSASGGKDTFYFDSGIFAAVQMINQVAELITHNSSLSKWIARLPKYHVSGELNFEIQDKESAIKKVEKYYSGKAEKISRLDGLTLESSGWWLNLRLSNTEDLVRLNFEARDKKIFEKELKNLKFLLTQLN